MRRVVLGPKKLPYMKEKKQLKNKIVSERKYVTLHYIFIKNDIFEIREFRDSLR